MHLSSLHLEAAAGSLPDLMCLMNENRTVMPMYLLLSRLQQAYFRHSMRLLSHRRLFVRCLGTTVVPILMEYWQFEAFCLNLKCVAEIFQYFEKVFFNNSIA